MGPVEFIKSCFIIACVILFFAIFVKVSFALVDWLVERIREATLKLKIKRLLMEYLESERESLENRKDLEEHEDEV
ncbi:hypothetical protein [uncultured Holdemanella sp.]|uniref:hypothetical protein n=1 Tax=uncultured Holdemanella sp. TaxID=1763549 RepID=UPI00258BD701|nr:hypothetical protein [uncultured Holdemanella sp.]